MSNSSEQENEIIKKLIQENKRLEEHAQGLEDKLAQRTQEIIALRNDLELVIQQRTSKLSSAYLALLDLNKELDTYIYRASHDIAGPLARFAGLCNIGLMEAETENIRKYFLLLGEESGYLRYVLTNLIRENEIRYKRLHLAKIDFRQLISEVLDSISTIRGFQEIAIKIEIDDKLVFENDPQMIKFIFFYLIHNAVLYRADISQRQPTIHILIQSIAYGGVEIILTDNGIGMSADIQGKVFNRFFRASSKSKGNGMGLYLTKAAVNQLNGMIALESELDKGSVFKVFLPHS